MRRGGLWWLWLLVGIVAGVVSGLVYAWQIDPRVVTDVRPAQLSKADTLRYLVVLSLTWAKDRQVIDAAQRLLALDLDWQDLAEAACEQVQSGYASTNTGLIAIRSMVELAASQGATSCASDLLLVATATPITPTPELPTATPTLIPPPSKTPTPDLPTPTNEPVSEQPTPTPAGAFVLVDIASFCDARLPGVIEVIVREVGGAGLPGVRIEATWNDGRDTFYTGLKPERDPGYADFVMTPGQSYQIQLPGLGERSRRLEANECTSQGGRQTPTQTSRTSYRVIFQRARR